MSPSNKQFVYRTSGDTCARCPQRANCTATKVRWFARTYFEEALQATAMRVQMRPDAMLRRKSIVEHPFGTIKDVILGNARLLLRGIDGAKAELSLATLAYNFKRTLNMKGASWMRNAIGA